MNGASSPAARLPMLPDPAPDARVQAVFERLRARWRGAPVLNLYRLLGWSPELVGPWLDFASALRLKVSADPALRELLIVRSGRLLEASYEWKHHHVIALNHGVSEAKLAAVDDWASSDIFNERERAVLALADETALGRGASAGTVERLCALFPTDEVVELIVTAGFYAGVARITNSMQVPLEAGFETMLPARH